MVEITDYEKAYREWKWEIPEFYNIGEDCVDKNAAMPTRKNKVALYWENEAGEERKYTYWEMRTLTNKFGNVLRDLGLRKGDRLLLRLPNIPEFQIAFIGAVKIGAVPIPSSVMFRTHEVEYRLRDSGAVAAITTPQYVREIEECRERCPELKHVIVVGEPRGDQLPFEELMRGASKRLELERTRSDDIAFFAYTSGTTGDPKAAVHLHRWVIANDPSVLFWQDIQEDDIIFHTGSLSWIYPLGNGFLYSWRHGGSTLVYDGRWDPEKYFQLMEKYEVTALLSVPTCYRQFLAIPDAEKRYDLSSLRHCISAGEPLNPEVVVEWEKRFGVTIYDGIGMTEVMVYLSNMRGLEVKPGSCGRPQPGHVCAVLDEEGRPLPPGKVGQLAVRRDDPGLFKEYWNKPEQTREAFHGEWFLTGDTVYMTEDGYFWFTARGDDLIMSAGYRISPFEVESAINSHPAVLESAAVASPDPIRGVIVKAFVVLKEGYEPSEELAREIQEHVKRTIAPYKYPRAVEFTKELPKTASGKIKRKLLRQQEEERARALQQK